jgi:hypothetical protein
VTLLSDTQVYMALDESIIDGDSGPTINGSLGLASTYLQYLPTYAFSVSSRPTSNGTSNALQFYRTGTYILCFCMEASESNVMIVHVGAHSFA